MSDKKKADKALKVKKEKVGIDKLGENTNQEFADELGRNANDGNHDGKRS